MIKKKVDISGIDLESEREKIADLPGLIQYAHHVGSAVIKPVDKGKIKGTALAAMRDQTDRQFRQLQEQMATLIDQARYLHKRVEISERIYQSNMGFEPVHNTTYFLYAKKNGEDVLSMVSPDEWGRSFPYEKCLAHVRLLTDHTWELIKTESDDFYT